MSMSLNLEEGRNQNGSLEDMGKKFLGGVNFGLDIILGLFDDCVDFIFPGKAARPHPLLMRKNC